MMKFVYFLLFTLSFLSRASAEDIVRRPAVSGMFYPADKSELRKFISEKLQKVFLPKITGDVLGIIVPHAGCVYSGHIAAWGYRLVEGKDYDAVVLIGMSHRAAFSGASVGRFDVFRTPLGDVPVDRGITEELLRNAKLFRFYEDADRAEHSLEVQVPFLQSVLKDFRIVTLLLGDCSLEEARAIADELIKVTQGKKVLFVASTDLSHYHPYEEAFRKDRATVQEIQKMDPEGFCRSVTEGKSELCGNGAVLTMMLIAKKLNAGEIKLLKYANSGDVPEGDQGRVVGYAAMAVLR